jgi:hypothetical protein
MKFRGWLGWVMAVGQLFVDVIREWVSRIEVYSKPIFTSRKVNLFRYLQTDEELVIGEIFAVHGSG